MPLNLKMSEHVFLVDKVKPVEQDEGELQRGTVFFFYSSVWEERCYQESMISLQRKGRITGRLKDLETDAGSLQWEGVGDRAAKDCSSWQSMEVKQPEMS